MGTGCGHRGTYIAGGGGGGGGGGEKGSNSCVLVTYWRNSLFSAIFFMTSIALRK